MQFVTQAACDGETVVTQIRPGGRNDWSANSFSFLWTFDNLWKAQPYTHSGVLHCESLQGQGLNDVMTQAFKVWYIIFISLYYTHELGSSLELKRIWQFTNLYSVVGLVQAPRQGCGLEMPCSGGCLSGSFLTIWDVKTILKAMSKVKFCTLKYRARSQHSIRPQASYE